MPEHPADSRRSACRRTPVSGSAMVELAMFLSLAVPVFLALSGFGMRLGRSLEATQASRDVARMYALGADFSLPGTQAIAATLTRDFSLTSSGNAVMILSRMVKVFQSDCTAAGLSNCPNQNLPVVAQRIVLGNSSLRPSAFVTPPAIYIDAKGNIAPADFCRQSTLVAQGFDAVISLQQGQSVWMVEGYFDMPRFAMMAHETGGYYVRFLL